MIDYILLTGSKGKLAKYRNKNVKKLTLSRKQTMNVSKSRRLLTE